jgi:hypothetical protein
VADGQENPTGALLRAALVHAGVNEGAAVLLVVDADPQPSAVECAYLPPGDWGDLELRVLNDARDELHRFGSLHRFAIYGRVDAPTAATAVGLRHEAEHAAQYDRYGRALFELESILRRGLRRSNRLAEDYAQIPSERQANRAAGAYAVANYPRDVAALAANPRYQAFVAATAQVNDLVEETVAMIWRYVNTDEGDDQDDNRRTFGVVVPELKQSVLDWVPMPAQHQPTRDQGTPLVVEIAAVPSPAEPDGCESTQAAHD